MKRPDKNSNLLFLGIALIWTVLIVSLLTSELNSSYQAVIDSAKIEGKASFNKDLVYRRWAASHGGVYVPVTKETPPNPDLAQIPNRDIKLPSGKTLTLMNPAYMSRQVYELAEGQYGVKGHITSLNPIRKDNAPDAWEAKALQSFKDGQAFAQELATIEQKPYLRTMYPMVTEDICLKCHEGQGYKIGDIRGGISVSVPLRPYEAIYAKLLPYKVAHYAVIWLVGLIGIIFVRSKINGQFHLINSQLESSIDLAEQLRRREYDLKESEKKYRMLFDYAAHGSALADAETGELLACNNKLAEMVGRSPNELMGRHQSFLHPQELAHTGQELAHTGQEQARAGQEQARAGQRTKSFHDHAGLKEGESIESQLIDKNGKIIDVEIKANRINIGGRDVLIGFFYDITERKKIFEEYRRSAQLAALGTIAAGVAHEINNPIQGIMNYATLLKNKPDQANRTVDVSERIIIESERIAEITRELLDFARDDRNRRELSDICCLVESAIDLIEKKVIRQGISIETNCPRGLPEVLLYPQGIQQVVINLIDNASDALHYKDLPIAEKVIKVSCYTVEVNKTRMMCLEVADPGIGMAKAVSEKATETFFSTKPSSRGTGLGLSIVTDIVNRHNGQVQIESVEGEYTKVKVSIPLPDDVS